MTDKIVYVYLISAHDIFTDKVFYYVVEDIKSVNTSSIFVISTVLFASGRDYKEARKRLSDNLENHAWGHIVRRRINKPLHHTPAIEAMSEAIKDGS